jgi:hypothetical protein
LLNPFFRIATANIVPKRFPLEPHRFVANVAATFMQQIPAIATRKQETDIDHHGHPDDLS